MPDNFDHLPEPFRDNAVWFRNFLGLIDHLKDVFLWVKDRDGRFVTANANFIRMAGRKTLGDLVGKTDFDFFPKALARGYVADDNAVLESGEVIKDRVELITGTNGATSWFSTTKIPFRNQEGKVIGTMGLSFDMKVLYDDYNPTMKMIPVAEYIRKNLKEEIDVKVLASIAELPVADFRRKFERWFHATPEDYILRMRAGGAT